MKYLEARPGVNIRKEDCIIVEKIDDMTCKISTPVGVVECMYPSWRVLQLLETPSIEEQIAMQPESPVDRTNLFGVQHWAG